MLIRKQRVRQLAEELLQQARNTVDIMEEVLRVPEVQRLTLGFGVKHVLELLDVLHGPALPVDTLYTETKEIHGLDTLVHRQGHG